MSPRDEIVQQALSLPLEDQWYLLSLLEQSVSTSEFASPEIAEAWAQEAERRLEAYERGEVAAVDWQTALSQLRHNLAARSSP